MNVMSTLRKTITVTKRQNEWIKTQIELGNFTNYSEYIRDLVRRELINSEKSGKPVAFDGEHFKMNMAIQHAR